MLKSLALSLSLMSVLSFARPNPATPEKDFDYASWERKPNDNFSHPEESFKKIKDLLLQTYYQSALTEEDLYRAATQGMLQYIDPTMATWNKLLTPTEYGELKGDLSGQIVGAGIEIKFDEETGYTDVLSVFSGSPADDAGIKSGDKILSVNGKLYKGMQLRDVVYDIRGKKGESRRISVLRGDKVFNKVLRLSPVAYANITTFSLPDSVGLIQVRYFSEHTAKELKEKVQSLVDKSTHGLIIDLRGNQGGLFEQAIESASLFIPTGSPVVKIIKRGNIAEAKASQIAPILQNVPIVILVNGETASGAEIFSAALKENIKSPLVGERTRGKWSLQMIEELPNHFAAKYTVGILQSAQGYAYNGKGLEPDVEVDTDGHEVSRFQKLTDPAKKLAADTQLRTAMHLLRR